MIKVDIANADKVHFRISQREKPKRSSAVSNQPEKIFQRPGGEERKCIPRYA